MTADPNERPQFSLANKVVLVTGGTAGLGRAAVLALAAAGAQVLFTGRNRKGAQETLDDLGAMGQSATFASQDTTSESDWQRVFAQLRTDYGRLDGLVNNAGVSRLKPIAELTAEDVDFLVRVNVYGMYLGIRYAFELMEAGGGRGAIINISALNALRGSPNSTAYALAKGGTTQLARAAAAEGRVQGRKIRVNALHPGVLFKEAPLPSPGAIALYGQAGAEAFVRSNIETTPLGRIGHPRDIGNAVAFLLSDHAEHISGAEICVDGGRSAGEFSNHHGIRSQR
jgi:3alpha(or 20beta)-hydroxysteroid dehydrogenase